MAHPIMFDDDDPLLARVSDIALGFPGAQVKVSHGRPAFYTQKVFAYYGGSLKVDGEYVQHRHSVMSLPDEAERPALLQDERCYVPAYLGPSGWLGIDLEPQSDWAEIAELIEESYRLTARKGLVKELDAR